MTEDEELEQQVLLLKREAAELNDTIIVTGDQEVRSRAIEILRGVQARLTVLKPQYQSLRARRRAEEISTAKERKEKKQEQSVCVCTLFHPQKGYRYFAANSSAGAIMVMLHEEAPGWFVICAGNVSERDCAHDEIPDSFFEKPMV